MENQDASAIATAAYKKMCELNGGPPRGACHVVALLLLRAIPHATIVLGNVHIEAMAGPEVVQHYWVEADGQEIDPLSDDWREYYPPDYPEIASWYPVDVIRREKTKTVQPSELERAWQDFLTRNPTEFFPYPPLYWLESPSSYRKAGKEKSRPTHVSPPSGRIFDPPPLRSASIK